MINDFRNMHKPGKPFVLANAWDLGSAKMMAALGAKAIGTSSAAHAFTLGRPDLGHVTRDEAISSAALMTNSVNLPISGDFENGYGHSKDDVAKTIGMAIDKGIQGGSIEDIRAPKEEPYSYAEAVERIEAAVEARRSCSGDIVITARADGVMYGQYDLAEGIRRAKAFGDAGADILFIPMPEDLGALAEICRSVGKPVNALCSGRFTEYSYDDFANAGVARISLGSSVARLTLRAIHESVKAIFETGDFSSLSNGIGGATIDEIFANLKGTPNG